MSILKKLVGQTALYGVSSIMGRLLNYFLVPLYTTLFIAAEYGVVTKVYAYVAVLNVVLTFGMETAYFRFATKNKENESQSFKLSFGFIFVLATIFALLVYIFRDQLASSIGTSSTVVKLTAYILFIDAIVAIPFARLRLNNKALLFATGRLFNIVINIAFNLLFLIGLNTDGIANLIPFSSYLNSHYTGIEFIFLANLLANFAYFPFLVSTFFVSKSKFSTSVLKEMLIYAYPIMLMGLAGVVNEMFSRQMLEVFLPPNFYGEGKSSMEALGVFGACYKISIFMTLAVQASRYALEPFFFSQSNKSNAKDLYAKITKYFTVLGCVIFLGVCLNLDAIGFLFLRQDTYREGLVIVPFLLIANLFLGIYYNLSVWYKLTDKTYWGTYISFFGAAITILVNWILIPYLGYLGSSIATLVCYFSMSAFSYIIGQKYYPVNYPLKYIFGHIIGVSLVVFIFFKLPIESILQKLIIGNGILIAYLIYVYFSEKKLIKSNSIN